METKKRSLFVNALIYGLLLSVCLIILSILLYVLDVNPFIFPLSIVVIVVNLALMILFMIWGTKKYRDTYFEGKLNFGKRFLSTVIIVLVGAIIVAIFSFVFNGYFDPDTFQSNFMELIDWMEGKGVPEGQIDKTLAKLDLYTTKPYRMLMDGWQNLILPVIISLIVAAFIKPQKRTDEEIH